MWETKWEDLKNSNEKILNKILEYNEKIKKGEYLEIPCGLEITYYYDFLTAHIINLLLDNEEFYIKKDVVDFLNLYESELMNFVEWNICEDRYSTQNLTTIQKDKLINQLVEFCFDEKRKNFIQEICAQDITNNESLAKDISSILSSISTIVDLEINGEEEFFRRLSELREKGKPMFITTEIQNKYAFEYRNRGTLIRNRVFKHNYAGNHIYPQIQLSNKGNNLLNYNKDKLFCQSALLHIGVESTGSTGTGFIISEDGYALTCAHVVEGAKEIYATVINGDGYKTFESSREGFEVYDAGEGEVIYANKQLDIALLKMECLDNEYLQIEQRNILPELGEEVVVFGYPLGYEMPQSNFFGPNISFYKGYVSSNQVNNGNSITFLDIDAKSGNSGSPVISVKTGKVIGIVSGIKVGGKAMLNEKMPYMIPIQHFIELNK